MPVTLKPTSVIKQRLGIEPNGRVHAFLTAECAKEMDLFTPADTLALARTVINEGVPTANVTTNTITYEVPYARYVYYGVSKYGKPMIYQKDKHELAGPYWDKRMVSAKMQDIIKSVQDYIDRGGN